MLCWLIASRSASTDTFEEELFVDQLPNGFVYSLFQFTTSWKVDIFEEELCELFRSLLISLKKLLKIIRFSL